jgi:hypothetical protein
MKTMTLKNWIGFAMMIFAAILCLIWTIQTGNHWIATTPEECIDDSICGIISVIGFILMISSKKK